MLCEVAFRTIHKSTHTHTRILTNIQTPDFSQCVIIFHKRGHFFHRQANEWASVTLHLRGATKQNVLLCAVNIVNTFAFHLRFCFLNFFCFVCQFLWFWMREHEIFVRVITFHVQNAVMLIKLNAVVEKFAHPISLLLQQCINSKNLIHIHSPFHWHSMVLILFFLVSTAVRIII